MVGDKLIAAKINGKYLMYWGHHGTLAESDDLVNWNFVYDQNGQRKMLFPNFLEAKYGHESCEAGAAAILTEHGIVYFFNAAEKIDESGAMYWTLGQALISSDDYCSVIDYLEEPYLSPDAEWEKQGHCGLPCLVANTIVKFNGRWHLYYGATDHKIGLAIEVKK